MSLRQALRASLRSLGINPDKPNPARDLANIGHAKRRAKIHSKARIMREQLGLPEHKALR